MNKILEMAFEAGAEAQLIILVKDCRELMKYDDSFEAFKLLSYYAEREGYADIVEMIEKEQENGIK